MIQQTNLALTTFTMQLGPLLALIAVPQVVRAAREIPAATELTLSYLGPQLFAPSAERQAELKQQWGFDCACARCALFRCCYFCCCSL
jgi:hypothetical protein